MVTHYLCKMVPLSAPLYIIVKKNKARHDRLAFSNFLSLAGHHLKYALIVWFAVTLVKVKLVFAPQFAPSTITLRT